MFSIYQYLSVKKVIMYIKLYFSFSKWFFKLAMGMGLIAKPDSCKNAFKYYSLSLSLWLPIHVLENKSCFEYAPVVDFGKCTNG